MCICSKTKVEEGRAVEANKLVAILSSLTDDNACISIVYYECQVNCIAFSSQKQQRGLLKKKKKSNCSI